MSNLKCLNCDGNKFKKLFKEKKYNLYTYFICKNCSLIQIDPFPTRKKLNEIYDYEENAIAHVGKINPYIRFASRLPFGNFFLTWYSLYCEKNRHALITNLSTKGKILDIGCSSGAFLSLFANNWDLYGIEIGKSLVEQAQKNVIRGHFYSEPIEKINFHKTVFDMVTMWHVLEHLDDPQELLKRVHKLLKKNGLFVLEVPNGNSLYRLIYGPYWQLLNPPGHLYFWTKESIQNYLEKYGFKIVEHRFVGIFHFGGQSSLTNLLSDRGIPFYLAIGISTFFLPISWLLNFFGVPFRENLIIVARLKSKT